MRGDPAAPEGGDDRRTVELLTGGEHGEPMRRDACRELLRDEFGDQRELLIGAGALQLDQRRRLRSGLQRRGWLRRARGNGLVEPRPDRGERWSDLDGARIERHLLSDGAGVAERLHERSGRGKRLTTLRERQRKEHRRR